MKVSAEWLKKYTTRITLDTGSIKEDITSGKISEPEGGFECTLGQKGIELVENHKLDVVKSFQIYIPKRGWADCRFR